MPILIVLTLVPTVSFYFYVLVQFWAEANRRRHHDTCAMIVPLESMRAREQEEEHNPRGRHESRSRRAVEPEPAPVSELAADWAEIEPPARSAVVAAHLGNRVAAFPSGTERLATRRAAKG
jgi:hypothetical protein